MTVTKRLVPVEHEPSQGKVVLVYPYGLILKLSYYIQVRERRWKMVTVHLEGALLKKHLTLSC